MKTYDDIADMFDSVADEHQRIADLLKKRDDPHHSEANAILARAEVVHAEACRRAAMAMRGRHPIRKRA